MRKTRVSRTHRPTQMGGRRITRAYIEAVLAAPAYTTPDAKDPTLTRVRAGRRVRWPDASGCVPPAT